MASSRQSFLPGAHPTFETKHKHGHGDCAADIASKPHDAVGPPEAESGASFFASAAVASSSGKRARVEDHQFVRVIDFHPAVLHHVQRLNTDVQQWRQYAAAVASQLMAKDEEIGAARRLNGLLEEQVHAAHAEAQAWRAAATSSEAAVAALRADLDHALCARARSQEEDAESCCFGSNAYNDGCEGDDATTSGACRGCGARDAVVVLLPCRHLSACAPCAAAAPACPTCGLPKAGRVAVNLV